jgi:hypothetical protein
MTVDVGHVLFHSRTRAALLQTLLVDGVSDSVSALARRVKMSLNAVAAEVRNLSRAGLLRVESVGPSDLVRSNPDHPATKPLVDFLRAVHALAREPSRPADEVEVKESLVAFGAPLLAYKGSEHFTLEETLLRGLRAAKEDPSLLRVLPLVLLKNASAVKWVVLKESARRAKLKAELGMLVELTADAAGQPDLKKNVKELADRRRKGSRFFNEPRSRYERQLTESVTPRAARKWGFRLNLTEDSLRSVLQKHGE